VEEQLIVQLFNRNYYYLHMHIDCTFSGQSSIVCISE